MKSLKLNSLVFPEVKVVRFGRYRDERGYFAETFRRSDFDQTGFLKETNLFQSNESYSQTNVIRGLHFQWNPYMGKLVRTMFGHMVDLILDIRLGSPNFGRIIAYDMPSKPEDDKAEWIWVPPGFAHGNFFLAPTMLEYVCSSEYNPNCEAGISPLATDIDWSKCDQKIKQQFDKIAASAIMTDKDRQGMNLAAWGKDPRSKNFTY
ncbi:dTDP-4-dehydrorhamnose 3,5-epimerase family protein [Patescibacteria group bacterium]|nr:dTDP-4-dehydrorhamnose 3,5-epimerase family protein [Patescibacteria group bacterium]MBU1931932.1 dTDP-4-dehydrorhamnose 3,5-epimerase family protein [Patescibacteria group bacterium]